MLGLEYTEWIMTDITRILAQLTDGQTNTAEKLLPLVYDELRRLAARKLADERPGQTLQATALVHEAWLRIARSGNQQCWNNRGHFFSAAAEAMRRILIETARKKKRIKRGGDQQRVPLDDLQLAVDVPVDEFLAVDEVLDELAAVDQQAAKLVKLRYFSGLSTEEAAAVLQIPARNAYRDWQFARAWLHSRLTPDRAP